MQRFRKLFDFYLDASIHVGIAVVSLYWISVFFLNLQPNKYLMAFLGLSTIVCYNFMKYGVEAEKYLILSNKYHKVIQAFSFLCFGAVVYFALQLKIEILVWTGLFGLLSVLYALPVLPGYNNLRSLGVLKIFIVALVWTGFTVLLPIIDVGVDVKWDESVLIVQRFLLVLALILPFEIRDMKFDPLEMQTVPQRLGLKGSIRFGYILVALFFLLTFLKDEFSWIEVGSRFLVGTLLIYALNKTTEAQSKYFSSFWVEGIPIFWWALLLVLGTNY